MQRVYGIAGDSLNGFTDALRTQPELAWVPARHEEAAAFAASAKADLTGELAVWLFTVEGVVGVGASATG